MTLIKDVQEGQSKHTHLLCCVGSDIGIGSRSVSIPFVCSGSYSTEPKIRLKQLVFTIYMLTVCLLRLTSTLLNNALVYTHYSMHAVGKQR